MIITITTTTTYSTTNNDSNNSAHTLVIPNRSYVLLVRDRPSERAKGSGNNGSDSLDANTCQMNVSKYVSKYTNKTTQGKYEWRIG